MSVVPTTSSRVSSDVRLIDRDRVDWRLLGWLAVWSLAMIVTMGATLNGQSPESLTEQGRTVLGLAIGGLAAAWIATGTWVALIHLPDVDDGNRQRSRPRVFVVLVWMMLAACLAVALRQSPSLFLQIGVMVAIGITGPMVVWHWTHRRIHHGDPFEANRRSIRQLLGVTFTAALAIAALNLSYRWTGMPVSLAVLIVFGAIMWTLMLLAMLCRWWAVIHLTIPLLAAEWFTVASLIDFRGKTAEGQLLQYGGCMFGFYCFALLFLMLMRSSGHRWLGASHRRMDSGSPAG